MADPPTINASAISDDPTTSIPPVFPAQLSAQSRLGIPFPSRVTLATLLGGFTGFALGAAQGGLMAGLRFRAENAHRLPTSQVGWYLYHKSKNYNAMYGGVVEGLRMSSRVALWTGLFFWVEEGVDRARGLVVRTWVELRAADNQKKMRRLREGSEDDAGVERVEEGEGVLWVQRDFLSSTVAAMGTAGAFSVWNRFPMGTAVGMAKMGLKAGLAYGLVQDAVAVLKGRRPGYVDFVARRVWRKGEEGEGRHLSGQTVPG